MRRYYCVSKKAIDENDRVVKVTNYWSEYVVFYLYWWDSTRSGKIPANGAENETELAAAAAKLTANIAHNMCECDAAGKPLGPSCKVQFSFRYETRHQTLTADEAEKIGLDKFVDLTKEGGTK